ncbi:MAG: ferredoxin-thioredoxin reductase catalytic domain-containing protein [Candidatus Heimdallarchaeaceae archaeon]
MEKLNLKIAKKVKSLPNYNLELFEDSTTDFEVFLFAISTCQWCKKGKNWLKDNKISYYFIDIDLINYNEKKEIKKEIRHAFNLEFIAFPFVVIDGEKYEMGFNKKKWEKLFHGIGRSKKSKTFEEVKKYVQNIAKKKNWKLHPNNDGTLDMLIQGLKDNYNRIGYFNCPCRDTNENIQLDRDICCPCDYAEEDINEYGRCYCALFFKKDYDFTKNQEIEMIPERRPKDRYT